MALGPPCSHMHKWNVLLILIDKGDAHSMYERIPNAPKNLIVEVSSALVTLALPQ